MTLTGRQDFNRREGHLTTERERNIRHGRASRPRQQTPPAQKEEMRHVNSLH